MNLLRGSSIFQSLQYRMRVAGVDLNSAQAVDAFLRQEYGSQTVPDYESDTCDCPRCGYAAQDETDTGLQDYLVTATVQIVVRGSSIADVGIAAKELLTDVIAVSEYKDDPANGITITRIIEWN